MYNPNKTSFTRVRRWLTGALSIGLFSAASVSAQPGPGDTFVHLFEWHWTDIAQECEQHLGPKGFAAVQVSPPQEHIQGDAWWTRYQPVSLNIDNSRSGTRAEFIDMVQRCDNVGVDIYVDAIINHMAAGSGTGTNGNTYSAGTSYPEFSANDFHPECTINPEDYGNDAWRVRNCRLVGLPDLRTGDEYVRNTLANYLNDLIDIGVKGFRIDASKHMPPEDIDAVVSRLNGNPYIFQEVIDLGNEAVSAFEYLGGGDVTEFRYSQQMGDQFKGGQLNWLESFGEPWGFLDGSAAVVFTDNHDNQRGHGAGGDTVLTYKDGELYDLANVFMLAWPYGYPKVMSSFAFTDTEAGPPGSPVHNNGSLNCFGSDWQCEHRWRPIANMVEFRSTAGSAGVNNWWDNGNNQIAFARGNAAFVVINREGNTLNRTFNTGLPEGEYCNVIDGDFDNGSCAGETVWVDSQGQADLSVSGMTALAIHQNARPDEEGVTPGPEPELLAATSICYSNNQNHSSPHVYHWAPSPAGALGEVSWPGVAMTANGDFYCFDPEVELDSLNVIFSDNGGSQTDDLTYSGNGCYNNGQWQTLESCGFEVEETAPVEGENTYVCYDNAAGYQNTHIYFWSPSGAVADVAWPGEAMHSNNGFLCYDTGAELTSLNVIFNDNGGAQTEDLSMGGDKTCYQQGQWTTLSDCGVSP